MTIGASRPFRTGEGRLLRGLFRLLAVGLLAIPATAALPSVHAAGSSTRDNGFGSALAQHAALIKPAVFVPSGHTDFVNGTTGHNIPSCGTLASPCQTIQYTITNIAGAGDTISIAAGTYNELVTISKDLELLGAGTATVPPSTPTTIIDGTGLTGSVVTVPKGVTAILDLLTIQHGSGTVPAGTGPQNILGGGIFDLGTLTIIDSSVINNMTASTLANAAEGVGGGIYSAPGSALTVSSSTISNNTAGNGPSTTSAGLFNDGGGIFSSSTLVVDESTISSNVVPGETLIAGTNSVGGGIDINTGGSLTLTSSTISANSVTATGSANGTGRALGGGIENDGTTTDTIANSTITGNTITGVAGDTTSGGGLRVNPAATVTLTNDTITSNKAVTTGAAPGTAVGGGVDNPQAVGNTILASNTTQVGAAAAVSSDCGTAVTTDNGGNLADDATCGFTAASSVNSSLTLAASIAPLANNGGETMTQALLTGSPAIDAGLATTCEAAPINNLDQRGLPRYAVQRGDCDAGAYDTGGGIVEPLTITGAFPITSFPAGPARLGFAASNNGTFTGVALQNFPIGYITFQLGGSVFTVRRPLTITCTNTLMGGDHCLGAMGVIQGVPQFVATPGATATITLSGFISTWQGAYAFGSIGAVTLTVSASPTGVITVSKVMVSVDGVPQVTWTAPFPFATSIIIQASSLFIP